MKPYIQEFCLVLAIILSGIACYTDIRERLIYNKHVLPFIFLGIALALPGGRHHLLASGAMIFALYVFLFCSRRLLNRISASIGGTGIPEGETPLGGGDVKLSFALALFLGHMPVLAGTAMASLLMVLAGGAMAWRTTGRPIALVYTVTGKLPGPPVAYGAALGPCSLLASVFICPMA